MLHAWVREAGLHCHKSNRFSLTVRIASCAKESIKNIMREVREAWRLW